MLRSTVSGLFLMAVIGLLPATSGFSQEEEKPADPMEQALQALPKIVDEPKLIDPATVLPAPLAAKATVDLSDSSLREVVQWLREKQKLVVLLDNNALSQAGILAGEPVSDKLVDAPVYLLLNRLRSLELAWYYEDDILHITSADAAEKRQATLPYNVGDLLDDGFSRDDLAETVQSSIDADTWEELGGAGVLSFLGDVMFVRHTQAVHRQVSGLLAALRKHARQTYVLDPPAHQVLREKLQQNLSVNLEEMPLDDAAKFLAGQAKVDIRLDELALQEAGIRSRQPVTIKLAERKLETILQAMLLELELTWILRDGVLWITSEETAEQANKTAVYDVRDLSRNEQESEALHQAIVSQTEANTWEELGGLGSLDFPKSGVMVLSNREGLHDQVLKLLDTYRTALRGSKPRDYVPEDPDAILTVYYKLHAKVAEDLAKMLPQLVQPESWKSEAEPLAVGEIFRLASSPDLPKVNAQFAVGSEKQEPEVTVLVERAVLIIRQRRATHEVIREVIRRVEYGDHPAAFGGPFGGVGIGGGAFGGGGFGGGQGGAGGAGGGFGGGFFAVPSQSGQKSSR